jgi:hypothetical protein
MVLLLMSSPTMSNKRRKCNAITPPGDAKTYPHLSQALGGEDGWCDAKTYPHLSQALGGEDGCFNPTNPAVLKSMRSLLSELNDLLSSTYQLEVSGLSHNKLSYVQVPWSKSDRSFLNSKEWVNTAIQITGSNHGGTFEAAYRISNHIIRNYHDSFLVAYESQRVSICKPMTTMQFQGMLSAGGVSGTSKKELKQHLSAHLGKGFCPTRQSVDMLAKGHSKVQYSKMEFTPYNGKEEAEYIEWTEKNINEEITIYLQWHSTSKSITPSDVARVQVVVGGENGDRAFQIGASVSDYVIGSRIFDFEVSVCELICRKDTSKLIESTILTQLTQGLDIVAMWNLHIEMNDNRGLVCKFKQTCLDSSHLVDIYVTGDLAFLVMALGKELMAGWWCMLCKASQAQLLDKDIKRWTMEDLVSCGMNAERNNSKPKLRVKQRPW